MLHLDGTTRTESSTGSAAFTLCFGDLHDRPSVLLDEAQSTVWAEIDTHPTAGTEILNTLGKVRFKFDFADMNRDGCG